LEVDEAPPPCFNDTPAMTANEPINVFFFLSVCVVVLSRRNLCSLLARSLPLDVHEAIKGAYFFFWRTARLTSELPTTNQVVIPPGTAIFPQCFHLSPETIRSFPGTPFLLAPKHAPGLSQFSCASPDRLLAKRDSACQNQFCDERPPPFRLWSALSS